MILTVSITFLLGTLVSAELSVTTPVVQNVISIQEPSKYVPLFPSGIPNNIVKPQLLHLAAHLPPQLQHLFDAIEKDNCERSLPILSPFLVNEFIREPVKFEEKLKIQDAHFARIPHYSVNDKPLVIAEPPKLPELSAKDLEILRKKISEDVIEKEQPKTVVIVPPAPELPPIEMPQLPVEKVVEPHLTLELIKENRPIAIPEPPKLPQLSIEELRLLKEQVPKYEIAKEEQRKHLVIEKNLPFDHKYHSIELPKFSKMVEEVPAIRPYVSSHLAEEVKPLVVPEPPKLPELSFEELGRLRTEVPKFVEVFSESPYKHIESHMELPKFPVVNGEVPSAEPHVKLPKIPEPPKLSQLSIEELERLEEQVPKYEIAKEKQRKHLVTENKPVIVSEPPNLPELPHIDIEHIRNKVPEYVIEREEPKTPSTLVEITSSPQLPQMIIPDLLRYAHIPCEHIDHSNLKALELPKFSKMVEEVPAIMPYVSSHLAELVKPLVVPEPPKLPALSFEDLGRLRTEVPKFVEVFSELPRKYIEPSRSESKFPVVNEEASSAEPHVKLPIIPKPPKLPQLSFEELRRLSTEVPKHGDEKMPDKRFLLFPMWNVLELYDSVINFADESLDAKNN